MALSFLKPPKALFAIYIVCALHACCSTPKRSYRINCKNANKFTSKQRCGTNFSRGLKSLMGWGNAHNHQQVASWMFVRTSVKEARLQNRVLTDRKYIRGIITRISVHINVTSEAYKKRYYVDVTGIRWRKTRLPREVLAATSQHHQEVSRGHSTQQQRANKESWRTHKLRKD